MTWLLYIFFGQLCLATAILVDRVFLNKIVKDGFVFAFLVGVLSISAVVLLPFGVRLPSWPELFINLLVGSSLSVGLLLLFLALARAEVTKVAPLVGGLTPIMTFLFSTLILGEILPLRVLASVGLLIVGSVILLRRVGGIRNEQRGGIEHNRIVHINERAENEHAEQASTFGLAALAAVAFALSLVLGRYQYIHAGFLTSFFWQRGGTLLVAAFLFMRADVRLGARLAMRKMWGATGAVFLGSKALGALGYVLIGYATKLVSATIVNALQGIHYLFLLVATMVVTLWRPRWLKEQVIGQALLWKLLGTLLIVSGIMGIALYG